VGLFTLARWLGPWADAKKAPDVAVRDDDLDGMRVRIYGQPKRRTFLIAPGLHYAGPDDPRLDRFCRVLARAGHLVIAPFIPAYLALEPSRHAIVDFARVFDALPRWSAGKPIVFSISFGSLLAFALAAERGDAIDRLIIFGGYKDFHATMRFCLTGPTRDPLNQCVVMLNLLDHLEYERGLRGELAAGWRRYVERTWGRPELKAPERFMPIAHEVAATVPAPVREMFLIGVGARPGTWDIALPALEKSVGAQELDPTPYLSQVRGRVELVHGADDDVIPFEQTHALAAALVNADVHVHVTGMYGHTGSRRPPLATLAKELATMVRVLRVLAA